MATVKKDFELYSEDGTLLAYVPRDADIPKILHAFGCPESAIRPCERKKRKSDADSSAA
jgi:hypothetical protein